MKIGFIGTGSMGSMLIDTLLEAKTIKEEDIVIINRTIEKAIKLKEIYPAIHIASDIEELTRQCRWIFICVKPKDIPSFTPTVIPYLSREHVMISITSPVSIHHLEELFPCKVARIIPSILNRAQSGSTLLVLALVAQALMKKRSFLLSHPYRVLYLLTRMLLESLLTL